MSGNLFKHGRELVGKRPGNLRKTVGNMIGTMAIKWSQNAWKIVKAWSDKGLESGAKHDGNGQKLFGNLSTTGRKNGPKATGDMLEKWFGKRDGKCQDKA